MESWRASSQHTFDEFIKHADLLYKKHGEVTFTWTTGNRRTAKQNNALHLWIRWLVKALNDAGLDMRKVLKPSIQIPWTEESAKEHLWHPVQKIVCGKEKSSDLDKKEVSEVYEVLNRHLSEKFGVSIEFPEYEKV